MSLTLGKEMAVSTSYIKSNPAVPIYKADDLFAIIYHIGIGYYEDSKEKLKEYIIIDYKEYTLADEDRTSLVEKANEYCKEKGIDTETNEIFLLDDEEAETFLEKLFDNMKVIRGLTTKRG